jgi:hypothetical protein
MKLKFQERTAHWWQSECKRYSVAICCSPNCVLPFTAFHGVTGGQDKDGCSVMPEKPRRLCDTTRSLCGLRQAYAPTTPASRMNVPRETSYPPVDNSTGARRMIKPTIGRVVWFWQNAAQAIAEGVQAMPALVTYVHSDECINATAFDSQGNTVALTRVTLWQGEGERPEGQHAEWMPYQLKQAAKAEAIEQFIGSSGDMQPIVIPELPPFMPAHYENTESFVPGAEQVNDAAGDAAQ